MKKELIKIFKKYKINNINLKNISLDIFNYINLKYYDFEKIKIYEGDIIYLKYSNKIIYYIGFCRKNYYKEDNDNNFLFDYKVLIRKRKLNKL